MDQVRLVDLVHGECQRGRERAMWQVDERLWKSSNCFEIDVSKPGSTRWLYMSLLSLGSGVYVGWYMGEVAGHQISQMHVGKGSRAESFPSRRSW